MPELAKEALIRIDKAARQYGEAASYLQGLLSTVGPGSPTKGTTRVLAHGQVALAAHHDKAVVHANQAIRLAYLRAGRAIDPDFKLTEEDDKAVQSFQATAKGELALAVRTVVDNSRRLVKRQVLSDMTEGVIPVLTPLTATTVRGPNGKNQALEQHARALLLLIGGQAASSATLAVAARTGYDLAAMYREQEDSDA